MGNIRNNLNQMKTTGNYESRATEAEITATPDLFKIHIILYTFNSVMREYIALQFLPRDDNRCKKRLYLQLMNDHFTLLCPISKSRESITIKLIDSYSRYFDWFDMKELPTNNSSSEQIHQIGPQNERRHKSTPVILQSSKAKEMAEGKRQIGMKRFYGGKNQRAKNRHDS